MYDRLILAGNVGKNAELKYTPEGKAICVFSVAVSRKIKDEYKTMWFRCVIWGDFGEHMAEKLTTGAKVLVEGRLLFDEKTGGPKLFKRNNGEMGTSFEVNADLVRIISASDKPADTDDIPY
jgi:single stranded DNA-binding protein